MSFPTFIYHWTSIGLGVLIFISNGLVSIIFIHFRKRLIYRSSARGSLAVHHNRLLFSMTLSDLLVGVLTVLYGYLLKTNQPKIIHKLCSVIPLFGTMFVSILSVAFITLDRVVAVVRPLKYQHWISDKCLKKMIILSWILPLFISIVATIVYLTNDFETELKVRACILSSIFLMGFVVLIVSNVMLILKMKDLKPAKYIRTTNDETTKRKSMSKDLAFESSTSQCLEAHLSGSTNAPSNNRKIWAGAVSYPHSQKKPSGVIKHHVKLNDGIEVAVSNDTGLEEGICMFAHKENSEPPKLASARDSNSYESSFRSTGQLQEKVEAGNTNEEAIATELNEWSKVPFRRATSDTVFLSSQSDSATDENAPSFVGYLNKEMKLGNTVEARNTAANTCTGWCYGLDTERYDSKKEKHGPGESKEELKTESDSKDKDEELKFDTALSSKTVSESKKTVSFCSGRLRDLDSLAVKTYSVKKRKLRKYGNREKMVTMLCICIVIIFVVCWFPLIGYRFSYVVGRYKSIVWFRRSSFLLALTNSLMNPVMYFLIRKDFRVLFGKLFSY